MARFTSIEIHFPAAGGNRTVILKDDGNVQGIFLNGKVPPKASRPHGLQIEGNLKVDDGDGPQVCYLIDGVLECW